MWYAHHIHFRCQGMTPRINDKRTEILQGCNPVMDSIKCLVLWVLWKVLISKYFQITCGCKSQTAGDGMYEMNAIIVSTKSNSNTLLFLPLSEIPCCPALAVTYVEQPWSLNVNSYAPWNQRPSPNEISGASCQPAGPKGTGPTLFPHLKI